MPLKAYLWDALALAGLALTTAGAALAWPPLGLLVPGVALMAAAWLGARGKE